MTYLRRFFRSLLWLVVLVLALPVVVLAVLQFPVGQTFVSAVVSSAASSDGQKIELKGLHLGFDLNLTLDSLTIADGRGIWLEIDKTAIRWEPLRLFSRVVAVDRISADRIALARPPVSESDQETPTQGEDGGGFSMPLGLDVRISAIDIPEIDLGGALLGTEIALALTGALALDPTPVTISGNIDVTRIDGIDGTIASNVIFAPEAETLAFEVQIREPRGGLIARLLEIQDLPALNLDLKGDGPLNDWAATLSIALDGRQTVSGSAQIASAANKRSLTFDLDGELGPLVPPVASAFVLGTTDLKGTIDFTADFQPRSGQATLKTQTVSAALSGGLDPDSQALTGKADVTVSAGNGALIALDLGDRRLAAGPVTVTARLDGALTKADWQVSIDADTLQTTEGRLGKLALTGSGQNADLRPTSLKSPFDLALDLTGFQATDPGLAALDGDMRLTSAGTVDGIDQTMTLARAELIAPIARLTLSETVLAAESVVTSGVLTLADLNRLSPLAGQPLSGSAKATFSLDADPVTLSATSGLSLTATNVATGIAMADRFLAGNTTLSADLTADGLDNIAISSLALAANGVSVTGDATLAGDTISADLEGNLSDLARLDPQLGGDVEFSANASGTLDTPVVTLNLGSQEILLAGTPLTDLAAAINATLSKSEPSGSVEISADLKGAPLRVSADLVSKDGGAVADPIDARLASNRVSGRMRIGDLTRALETLDGDIRIDAPELAELSPLVLTDIAGALSGDLIARPAGTSSEALKVDLNATGLVMPGAEIDTLALAASAAALDNVNSFRAKLTAGNILAGSTLVHSAEVDVVPNGDGITVDAVVALTEGKAPDGLSFSASLEQTDGGGRAALSRLSGRYQGIKTELAAPANLVYDNGTARIDGLALKLGSGQMAMTGTAGDLLDLSVQLTNIPVALANSVQPGLGLGGTLSGTVTATGSSADPKVGWSIRGAGLTAAQLSGNGIAALSLTSSGTFQNNALTQDTSVSGDGGLALKASGRVGIAGDGSLAITLAGDAPLAAIRRPLTQAGFRGEGTVAIAGTVSGSFKAPQYAVTATPRGLRVTSLNTGLTVQDLTGNVSVTQSGVTLNSLRGAVASGGSISASGTVGLGSAMVANINAKLDQARYIDPGLVTATIDADINVTGDLAGTTGSALIAGTVTIVKADIAVPSTLPGAVSPVAVRHVNAPRAVRDQVQELGGEPRPAAEGTSNPPRLDVTLSAPGRIFVRGRGLDAELGGNLKIIGTTDNPQAIGAFDMRRGQLEILTRRLTFSRGNATFSGSMTPVLDFLATTSVSNTTINVGVQGNADDPTISFTSSPELPQDETLALLLFGRSVGNLSPTQIAQLAASIAVLTGGSDSGPLANIRRSLGLDVIDVNTDGDNGASVAVGKYINDNIYLGVEQGTGTNSSRVQVDIELDRGVKVRGEVGADGSSKAGIFFEREY